MTVAGELGALLVGCGAGALAVAATLAADAPEGWLSRRERRLGGDLGFLRARLRARHVTLLQLGGILLAVVLALGAAHPGPLAVVPLLAVGPGVFIRRARVRRVQRLEEQLDGWLVALANALRASPSLGDAIRSTVGPCPPPLAEELAQVLHEQSLGVPMDQALDAMARRTGSAVLGGALLALTIARTTGGDLPGTLDSAAAALRELARLEGVFRARVAEGKTQALVVSAVPAPLVAGMHATTPGYFEPLLRSAAGVGVIAAAVALWCGAVAVALRISAVDV